MDESALNLVFRKKDGLLYEEKEGRIFVHKLQDRKIQRGLRKIGIRIPEKSSMELDAYGSLVFKEIDGVKTVREIGVALSNEYEESQEFLYERLLLYLNHLDKVEKWIELVE